MPGSFDENLGNLSEHPVASIAIAVGVVLLIVIVGRIAWRKLKKLWLQAKQGGVILSRPKEYMTRAFLPSFLSWLCKLAVIGIFLAAFAIPVTFESIMWVTGSGSLANVVSFTPGAVGITQATNALALDTCCDVAKDTAVAYSTAQQLITTAWNAVVALVLVVLVFGWSGGKQLVGESYGDAKVKVAEQKAAARREEGGQARGAGGKRRGRFHRVPAHEETTGRRRQRGSTRWLATMREARMNDDDRRRVELILPMRTVLLVAATLGVLAAFREIGDTFLIVFVGIFLGLVFEYPVRFVMAKTHMSRGLAATVTVLGTALAVVLLALLLLVPLVGERARLPAGPSADGAEPARLQRARLVGGSGAAENVQSGADTDLRVGAGRDQRGARHRRRLLRDLPGRLHDHLHLPVPAHRRRQPQAVARQRADAGRGRALARRLGARHRRRSPAGRSASIVIAVIAGTTQGVTA